MFHAKKAIGEKWFGAGILMAMLSFVENAALREALIGGKIWKDKYLIGTKRIMTKIHFRFKVFRILCKGIYLRLPFEVRFRFSKWITEIVEKFYKFDSPKPYKQPNIIEVDNFDDLEHET